MVDPPVTYARVEQDGRVTDDRAEHLERGESAVGLALAVVGAVDAIDARWQQAGSPTAVGFPQSALPRSRS